MDISNWVGIEFIFHDLYIFKTRFINGDVDKNSCRKTVDYYSILSHTYDKCTDSITVQFARPDFTNTDIYQDDEIFIKLI